MLIISELNYLIILFSSSNNSKQEINLEKIE